jgi:hypothetical protein
VKDRANAEESESRNVAVVWCSKETSPKKDYRATAKRCGNEENEGNQDAMEAYTRPSPEGSAGFGPVTWVFIRICMTTLVCCHIHSNGLDVSMQLTSDLLFCSVANRGTSLISTC